MVTDSRTRCKAVTRFPAAFAVRDDLPSEFGLRLTGRRAPSVRLRAVRRCATMTELPVPSTRSRDSIPDRRRDRYGPVRRTVRHLLPHRSWSPVAWPLSVTRPRFRVV
ncbi:MAG TPA: hypothetical protein DCQ98_17250 [Planctomycetaceae bacterium]|nr:hypothetical protein [Planctomycetaceae bacterium]